MIDVRSHTVDEEFEYLWNILQRIPFYNENNYIISLPAIKEFQPLINGEIPINNANKTKYKELFANKEYSASFYDKGIEMIKGNILKIKEFSNQLQIFHKDWDFKILNEYQILLTRYGPAGSYNPNTGAILMMTRKDGSFVRTNPIHTIIHEILHIGIEDIIINKYKLSHAEKESLVDWIVVKSFGNLLPDYEVQKKFQGNLVKNLEKSSLKKLPQEVAQLVE